MTTVFIIALIAVIGLLAALLIAREPSRGGEMEMLQREMQNLRAQLSENISKNSDSVNKNLTGIIEVVNNQLNAVTGQMLNSQKTVGERLDNAARTVSEVQKGIGALSQAAERIFEVGKDISGLQEILRSPKIRGGFGELLLGDILAQMLPAENFGLQHKFKSGETVDAVIMLGAGMVPVDAKFPLENFKRLIETQDETEKKAAAKKFGSDVKKHIDSIASKYILSDEGTFDFALMYIPAENVYYETIIKSTQESDGPGISDYALSKKVIPVSPNSFYAYLQAIVLGLKGMRVEKSAREIIQRLERLRGDFERFRKEFDTLGGHINNVKNKYDEASRRMENLGEKLLSAGEEGQALPPADGAER